MSRLLFAAILAISELLLLGVKACPGKPIYFLPKPFNEDYLSVSNLHKLWYAEYDNPEKSKRR